MVKNSKLYYSLAGIALLVGLGAYFLLKKPKDKSDIEEEELSEEATPETPTQTVSSPVKKPAPAKTPKDLDTVQKVMSFQTWMDSKGKPWINVNGKWHFLKSGNPNVNGKGYGIYGRNTAVAWKVFGKQYLADKAKWTGGV